MEYEQVIKGRRSARGYKQESVPKEVLEEVIFLEHLLLFGQDIRLKCFTGLKVFVCVKMNTLPGV